MDTAEIRISHRALQGINQDDLYLIPVELGALPEFPLSPTAKFVRCQPNAFQRPVYDFGAWKREDGTPCEEEPGMIYAMGHIVRVVPPPAPSAAPENA